MTKKANKTGYEVDNITAIINRVKKNDQTMALLDQLQELIETMAGTWSTNPAPADLLIYKDKEGNQMNQFEFWDNLHYFVDRNQDYIQRDSRNAYEELKKQKRY